MAMTVVMTFVITMIFFMIIMIVVVIIVVAMIFVMVVMVVVMIFFMIIDMNLAIEMFSFSPNQSGSNSSFDRERTSICEAPFKDASKHAIDGVMLGIPLKVGVKSTMAFDGDDWREVEFTGFKGFTRSTM